MFRFYNNQNISFDLHLSLTAASSRVAVDVCQIEIERRNNFYDKESNRVSQT